MSTEISQTEITYFKNKLEGQEKSRQTIDKYVRDVKKLQAFLRERPISKTEVREFKEKLMREYKTTSVNSILVAVNFFLEMLGLDDYKVKRVKEQRSMFLPKERELSREEYVRLLSAARSKPNKRLYYIMQTIAGTGIRISELRFITVKGVKRGKVEIRNKGKVRTIVISDDVKKLLREYCQQNDIHNGVIFRTKTGKPVTRGNVWREMKKICQEAGVEPEKVFPHNLRKLFARAFYKVNRDVVKLAAILGHKSIETTRIYLMESTEECAKHLNRLGLVFHMRT